MDLDLKNKICLITGANGGIGLATSQAFLKEGSVVCAGYRGSDTKLDELRQWMRDNDIPSARMVPTQTDLDNEAQLRDVVTGIREKFGRIDILVNNAGHVVESPFAITDDEAWENMLGVNLMSAVRLSRLVSKEMILQKKGVIINVSSIVAHAVGRGLAAYASAKAAMSRMTEIMALELARKGIRVNAVAPGAIRTRMASALITLGYDELMDHTPMKRIGEVDEAANSILFLASDKAAGFITGHILYVDGGIHL